MPRHPDTIAALATPVGTAAIAVVRVSGPDTSALAAKLGGGAPAARAARYIDYRARDGELIDDVLLTFFRGPNSYTGEDSLEVSCHGNPFIAQKILQDLLARGCRSAEPGEFTQRAFLNGKMDLSQAEAVMDVINARSERALMAAHAQLRGGLAKRMDELIGALLGVVARIEVYIDFPEEDLPNEDRSAVEDDLRRLMLDTNRLMATSRYGELLRDGIKAVIVGAPNAGKSSLLNRLVGRERALVSSEPGTTRDFLEERILVGAHCLRLIDTAGIHLAPGPIERLGIEKTYERVAEADVFLLLVDASRASDHPPLPAELLERLIPERTIVILNKMDLVSFPPKSEYPAGMVILLASALTGAGLEEIRSAIVAKAERFRQDPEDHVAINARHLHALSEARACLERAGGILSSRGPMELVASELRGVLAAYGEIAGRIDNERMLDRLFAAFCIGK